MPDDKAKENSKNITRQYSGVTRQERSEILGFSGLTVWMTGLSGSGKSTIAFAIETALLAEGTPVFVLDGDNLRYGINGDLGFSAADRKENVRRASEISLLMAEAGLVSIVPIISPYCSGREYARNIHSKSETPFFEIFIDTPLDICESRDPKGLYKKARKGLIKDFTGIDDPYEVPDSPDLLVRTEEGKLEKHVNEIMRLIKGTAS